MSEGFEKLHTPPPGPEISPEEREEILQKIEKLEGELRELMGSGAWERFDSVGVPYENLFKKEQDTVHSVKALREELNDLRRSVGLMPFTP